MNKIFLKFGPITIYWYSVTMLLAVLIALYIIDKESKKQKLYDFISKITTYVIIFGILGARIYYVAFNFSEYKYNLIDIFKIWEGGIAIYGAIIGGLLTIAYFSIKERISILKITDIVAPGLIIAQSIGRWGNFFNQEAHGIQVSLNFLKNLHLPKFIINGMYINGEYYHPTFLYESVWCFIGFIILLFFKKYIIKIEGMTTYIYMIWYGIGRFMIEGLRTDSLYLGIFRVSQLVSVAIILIGLIGVVYTYLKKGKYCNERK